MSLPTECCTSGDKPSYSFSAAQDLSKAGDQELADRVRAGDGEAFAELFRRHERAARRFASLYAKDPHTAQDLVAEAFVRVLHVLRSGSGPSSSFRGYLMTVLRNIVTEWSRIADRQVPVPDVTAYEHETVISAGSEALRNMDHSLVLQALASLPERWQDVLWYTVVQAEEPADLAGILGISPNSVAALAYRAREGLRQAYLTAHLKPRSWSARCEYFVERLATYSRGRLGQCAAEAMRGHLQTCERCRNMHEETQDINSTLRM
ncbi:RNA polymerase sigma factor [Kitasatospora azatica]|uniref:RNA polymerase sigma factor n=1 Tax=Kitasatospora azatica TaxID=58347 RepID=UPI0018DE80A8|nr:sigma-70 family RNA polymerase sigma factor [Kitasatospora azatica]